MVQSKNKVKLKSVCYRLPVDVQKAVNSHAESRGMKKSSLVELAIRRYLRVPRKRAA